MSTCIFCKILAGEIPSTVVYEDETVYAFRDIEPQAPVHVVLVPRMHMDSIADENAPAVAERLFAAVPKIAELEGIAQTGYRVVVNTGRDGGQTVHHLHLHILGGRNLQWPPG